MTHEEALRNLVRAWEATKPGHTTRHEIQRWLAQDMKPAIDAARAVLAGNDPRDRQAILEALNHRNNVKREY